jgi:hypothetical protein
MIDYKEKVEILTGLMLRAEEENERIELILDADLAFDIAVELQCELGKRFYCECDEDEFDYLLTHEDILSLTTSRDDKGILYFLSETKYGDITLESEADVFYIHENVFDKIDTNRLIGEIAILQECDDTEEDMDEEELDELIEELTGEVLQAIIDNQDNPEFCLHCEIKDAITEAYEIGFRDGIEEE